MKRTQHLLLALATGATAALTGCDYHYTPGLNPQYREGFSLADAPPARKMEINADSINYKQDAYTPIGKGSAADQKTSVNAALESAPGGNSATSPQAASGKPNTVGTATDGQNQNDTKSPAQN